MAQSGLNASLSTLGAVLFSAETDGEAVTIFVKCLASSTNSINLNVDPNNPIGVTGLRLEPGDSVYIRAGENGRGLIQSVFAASTTGTASVTWCVAAMSV